MQYLLSNEDVVDRDVYQLDSIAETTQNEETYTSSKQDLEIFCKYLMRYFPL
jgi:hypothetical protein